MTHKMVDIVQASIPLLSRAFETAYATASQICQGSMCTLFTAVLTDSAFLVWYHIRCNSDSRPFMTIGTAGRH